MQGCRRYPQRGREDSNAVMKHAVRNILAPTLTALAAAMILLAAPSAEASRYLSLRVLVVVYPHTFADLASTEKDTRVWQAVDDAVDHFWRGSRMRLHLAVDRVVIGRYLAEDQFWEAEPQRYWLSGRDRGGVNSVEEDLEDLGYAPDSYDVVAVFYAFRNLPAHRSRFGGAAYGVNRILGKAAYLAIPMAWSPKKLNSILEHELLHTLSSIFRSSGYQAFPHVHNGGFFKLANGRDADWQGWVLRNIPDHSYHEPAGVWGTVREFADKDGDGLPDYSPPWDQLVITEANFGTSRLLPDSDGDGVSDLDEAIRDGLPREAEMSGTDAKAEEEDGRP
jgi:hypothetical protein